MKRTIISGITLNKAPEAVAYPSNDKAIPTSDRKVCYPLNAYLDMIIEPEDELKLILLAKSNDDETSKKNIELFKTELAAINEKIGAKLEYHVIETDFSENREVHVELMDKLIDAIDDGSHIIADITYGPKDLPIEIFSALKFAEKFLNCDIDNILYGHAEFINGKPSNTRLCDMTALFYLCSLTENIVSEEPDRARKMLKNLISF